MTKIVFPTIFRNYNRVTIDFFGTFWVIFRENDQEITEIKKIQMIMSHVIY